MAKALKIARVLQAETITLERSHVVKRLLEVEAKASREGNHKAALKALELLGKTLGLYVDKQAVATTSYEDLLREARAKALGGTPDSDSGEGEQ